MEYKTLRAYGKAELAQLYSPGASRASALRLLNKYLHATDGLLEALQRTGYTRGSRHFTRYQVRLIFEFLGELRSPRTMTLTLKKVHACTARGACM